MTDIVIFENDTHSVEVRLDGQTVWLTQAQMAELFGTSTDNVSLHLKNVYGEHELEESATTEDYSLVRKEGSRWVNRTLRHYNLDAIISVGYRVNSARATKFRQWATRVLREHLTQGFSLNEHRLARVGLAELEQAVHVLGKTLVSQQLVSDVGREVAGLILGYARTWRLILDYDENRLGIPLARSRREASFDSGRRAGRWTPWLPSSRAGVRRASCSPSIVAMDWLPSSGTSNRRCSANRSTRLARSAPLTCSTS
jgi:prophage antirepressor-like protein